MPDTDKQLHTGIQSEVPLTHPMRAAWQIYENTPEYANSKKWAIHPQHVDGSLWAAFCQGYERNMVSTGIYLALKNIIDGFDIGAIEITSEHEDELDRALVQAREALETALANVKGGV